MAGVEYQIAVDGYHGEIGTITLSLDFLPAPTGELSDGLDTTLPLANSGLASWRYDRAVSHDGTDSVSARIGKYGRATLETSVTGPGFVSFYWKVHAEGFGGDFSFSVDGRAEVTEYYPDDQWHVGQGRLLPTTAVDQLAATLGRWFGAEPAELNQILPNLRNFGGSLAGVNYPIDLGFMR